MEKKISRIKPLIGETGEPYSITFEPQEVAIIDEMVTIFGDTRDEVVIKSLSLLYTIYKANPDAKVVFTQLDGKKIVIPIK